MLITKSHQYELPIDSAGAIATVCPEELTDRNDRRRKVRTPRLMSAACQYVDTDDCVGFGLTSVGGFQIVAFFRLAPKEPGITKPIASVGGLVDAGHNITLGRAFRPPPALGAQVGMRRTSTSMTKCSTGFCLGPTRAFRGREIHAVEELGLTYARCVIVPAVHIAAKEADEVSKPDHDAVGAYRMVCARLNDDTLDRPVPQYPCKECAHAAARPRASGVTMLKRIGRCPLQRIFAPHESATLNGFSDANFGGCSATRRSTSCGAIMFGRHVVHMLSTTQARRAVERRKRAARRDSVCGGVLRDAAAACGLALRAGHD